MKGSTSGSDVTTETSLATVRATFAKALRRGSSWPEDDQILDVIYWLRQIVGLILGLLWGGAGLSGFLGIIGYVIASTALVHVYLVNYQQVDDEGLGGFWEIAKEGFMAAFATFVVAWITLYSALHAATDIDAF